MVVVRLRLLARPFVTLAPAGLTFSHYGKKDDGCFPPSLFPPSRGGVSWKNGLAQCIGGEWVKSTSDATLEVEDPSTGKVIGRIPVGTTADAHKALVAAKAAQPTWAAKPACERGEALKAMARGVRANRVALAEQLAAEQNKTIGLAQVEIDFTAEYFEYYAGFARIYQGEIINSDAANENIYLHKVPLGVSVGICPWNFPVFVMARKLAPALLTGNTVVVKTSEVTLRAERSDV